MRKLFSPDPSPLAGTTGLPDWPGIKTEAQAQRYHPISALAGIPEKPSSRLEIEQFYHMYR
jgi:hypothetical protein